MRKACLTNEQAWGRVLTAQDALGLERAGDVGPVYAEPKIPAVITNSSTLSQKSLLWEPTQPQIAENLGGGNRLIHGEPKTSAVGTNFIHADPKISVAGTSSIHAEPGIPAV